VRVRVERDEFCDDEPGPPKAAEGVHISGQARRVPYTITVSPLHLLKAIPYGGTGLEPFFDTALFQCSIAEQGLGPIPWWKASEAAMEEG